MNFDDVVDVGIEISLVVLSDMVKFAVKVDTLEVIVEVESIEVVLVCCARVVGIVGSKTSLSSISSRFMYQGPVRT